MKPSEKKRTTAAKIAVWIVMVFFGCQCLVFAAPTSKENSRTKASVKTTATSVKWLGPQPEPPDRSINKKAKTRKR